MPEVGPRFQCAVAQVPLDYSKPRGGARSRLALTRLPATDPAAPDRFAVPESRRAGRLGRRLRPRRRAVPLHRRGAGALRPRRLRPARDHPQHAAALLPTARTSGRSSRRLAFPITREEEQQWIATDRAIDRACRERGGPIRDHMSTANVARDLDVLRDLVGDDKLSYAGVSYGSYLGVDLREPVPRAGCARSWSTACSTRSRGRRAAAIEGFLVPFSTRLRSDAGAQATLQEFFRLCDAGGPRCAFSGGAAARFAALARRRCARSRSRSPTRTASTETIDYSILIGITLGAMYDSFIWPDFAAVPGAGRGAGERAARIAADSARDRTVDRGPRFMPPGASSRRGGGIEDGVPELPRGLPGRGVLGLHQPAPLRRVVDQRRARRRPVRLLRPHLDVGVEHLRRVARPRRGPLHRPVQPRHRQPGARGRQPLRPGHAATRAR